MQSVQPSPQPPPKPQQQRKEDNDVVQAEVALAQPTIVVLKEEPGFSATVQDDKLTIAIRVKDEVRCLTIPRNAAETECRDLSPFNFGPSRFGFRVLCVQFVPGGKERHVTGINVMNEDQKEHLRLFKLASNALFAFVTGRMEVI